MTLEETIYWIVMIFFALPIALGAILYIWRTFAAFFRGSQHEEDDEENHDQYWKEPEKHKQD